MLLAYSKEGVANTHVTPWQIEFDAFAAALRTPDIGDKDGAYFIRGGQFNGKVYRDDAHLLAADLLVLDGDKRLIPETGEVIKGAVEPVLVHEVLKMLDITHLIYSSHSNDRDYHRYRVCMPVPLANTDELRACVDWLIEQLHQNAVWLATVDENYSWSRPWYTPRVPDAIHPDLFRFYEHDGGEPFPKTAALAWHAARQATPDRKITAEQTTRSLVAKLGRRLRTGDGRRPLLISYLASLSSCGSDAAALHKAAASFAAEFFDTADPAAPKDVEGIIRWLVKRDADRPKNEQPHPGADEPLDRWTPASPRG